jgi:hypothetical protein
MDSRRLAADRLDDARRGAQRVLVGREADDLVQAELGHQRFQRLAGFVGDDGLDGGAPDRSHRRIVRQAIRHGPSTPDSR